MYAMMSPPSCCQSGEGQLVLYTSILQNPQRFPAKNPAPRIAGGGALIFPASYSQPGI